MTALPEEYEAVAQVVEGVLEGGWHPYDVPIGKEGFGGLEARRATFQTQQGALTILAIPQAHMGQGQAGQLATMLIERYKPKVLCMSGICAGRSDKVGLGDVILADRVFTIGQGKRGTDGHGKETLQDDQHHYSVESPWDQRLEPFVNRWQKRDHAWLIERPLCLTYQQHWLMEQLLVEPTVDPRTHPSAPQECPNGNLVVQTLLKSKCIKQADLRPKLTPKGKAEIKAVLFEHMSVPKPKAFKAVKAPIASGHQVVECPDAFGLITPTMVNQAASGNLRAFREMRELMSVREDLCAREQAQELEASQTKEQAHAAVFQQLRHRFQQIQASSDAMDDSDSETA